MLKSLSLRLKWAWILKRYDRLTINKFLRESSRKTLAACFEGTRNPPRSDHQLANNISFRNFIATLYLMASRERNIIFLPLLANRR